MGWDGEGWRGMEGEKGRMCVSVLTLACRLEGCKGR